MRKLSTIQKREKLNCVFAIDEKGCGNANHEYIIANKETEEELHDGCNIFATIKFQNGARKSKDSVHGIIDTDLLEIVRDRLIGFQSGDFASDYNAKALEHLEIALMYLNRRVEDRIERNVLGKNEK